MVALAPIEPEAENVDLVPARMPWAKPAARAERIAETPITPPIRIAAGARGSRKLAT
jgi:hypothetical protein